MASFPAGTYRLLIKQNGIEVYADSGCELIDGLTTRRETFAPPSKQSDMPDLAIPVPVGDSTLKVDTRIPGVDVIIDGQPAGLTDANGVYFTGITIGQHEIEIRKVGFVGQRKTVFVNSDLTQTEKFVMQLQVAPELSGSNVLIIVLVLALLFLIIIATIVILRTRSRLGKDQGKFDRYSIRGIIGRGGMATIYRAKDTKTGKMVALKVMDVGYLTDADLVTKFMREGRTIEEINREFPEAPLVRVFRYGRESNKTYGRPFIAMEILSGQDLLKLFKAKGRFSMDFVISVVKQVGEALKPAHVKGIYHRDVSPDNIIVVKNDAHSPVIRLIDFGVARHEYTSAGTLDGSISGKPPYMSPEQCRGEKVDGRSDIYSLGVIFYTFITGNPPFISRNPLEVMKHHERTPVPPLPSDVPTRVKAIIFKMLEKDPVRRYQSVNDLLDDLEMIS
ncbi:MAG: protein kinase [Deltaproteobacteria bacterium]|nr:protein kinase [Deltaproteobacteria bacterium]